MQIGPRVALVLVVVVALGGCSYGGPQNPTFALTTDAAERDLERMENEPVRLERPVVVLGGWGDPLGVPPSRLADRLRELTGDDRIIAVGMGWSSDFDDLRDRVLRRVHEAFPSDDPGQTVEVDVVGFSMGGLIARYSALAPGEAESRRRLRIARLFDISVPIRGAAWASFPTIDPLSRGMRNGSDFLRALSDARRDASFETYHYVRLDDAIVGETNAAPPGQTAWWVPSRFLEQSHAHAYKDPRIVADIARRLRDEAPFTTEPPAPLPSE